MWPPSLCHPERSEGSRRTFRRPASITQSSPLSERARPCKLNKEPIVKIISKAEDFASFETYKKWLAKNEGKIRVVNVVYNPDRVGMFRSKRYLVTYEVQEGAEPDTKPDHWKF